MVSIRVFSASLESTLHFLVTNNKNAQIFCSEPVVNGLYNYRRSKFVSLSTTCYSYERLYPKVLYIILTTTRYEFWIRLWTFLETYQIQIIIIYHYNIHHKFLIWFLTVVNYLQEKWNKHNNGIMNSPLLQSFIWLCPSMFTISLYVYLSTGLPYQSKF